MNNKASEKINAAMFILYLVIIAGGVTIIMASYLNTPVDVRSFESQILYDNLMNCFVNDGFVNNNVLNSSFDVFSACHINSQVINDSNLFFEFSFVNGTGAEFRDKIKGGYLQELNSVRNNCDVYGGTQRQKPSWCFFRNETYLVSTSSGVQNIIIVGWVASNNQGVRNVKVK